MAKAKFIMVLHYQTQELNATVNLTVQHRTMAMSSILYLQFHSFISKEPSRISTCLPLRNLQILAATNVID
jgi:hypothetical protein